MFPLQGTYYPVCEYLGIYLCVLLGLYHFFGEDEGTTEVLKNVSLSVGQSQR